jgi:hypothetical protein
MMILDKGMEIRLFCCRKFGVIRFGRGEGKRVHKFEQFLKYAIVFTYAGEVLFTLLDLILSSESRKEAIDPSSSKKV